MNKTSPLKRSYEQRDQSLEITEVITRQRSPQKFKLFGKAKHPKSLWKDETLQPREIGEKDGDIFKIIMPWVQEQEDEKKKLNKQTKGKASSLDSKDELVYLSKVIKVGAVEEFNFEFADKDFEDGQSRMKQITDVEAILINPRWADHGFDPVSQTILPSEGAERRKAFAGITLQEFFRLKIPDSVMREGILFIWVEKELMYEIIVFFEKQGFSYVENACHVMLDRTQRESTIKMRNTDATPALARLDYNFLAKSHRTLLMMRRTKKESGNSLELRHQRTGDVVFDWVDDLDRFKTPTYYTYKMIETLLPKAMNKLLQGKVTKEAFEKARKFKMVELWAKDDTPRKGWLKVVSLR